MATGLRNYLSGQVIQHPRVHGLLNRLAAPDQDIDITLFGTRLRVNRRKESGYVRAARIAGSSTCLLHESASLMSLALILSPNDTFVDIGANVGLYAAQIAKLQAVYPRLRIYAFEAHPETAGRLRESMIGRNVVIHAVAVSAREERLAFVGGAVSFVFGAAGHDRSFQTGRVIANLDARPLDSFPIEGDALVLKIDVEGHEREVLAGASGFLETNRIKAVYLDGYEDRTIPDSLERLGFRLFDGRSLKAERPQFSLLAIHGRHLAE